MTHEARGTPGAVAQKDGLTFTLPSEQFEQLAERAADLLDERIAEREQTPGFLDVAGAAAFLACPKSRIYALVNARRIPHHRDGSRLLFDPGELREFVAGGGAKRP